MESKKGRRSFLIDLFSLMAFGAGSIYSFGKNKERNMGRSGLISANVSGAQAMEGLSSGVRKIAVEEHFTTEKILNYLASRVKEGVIYNSQRPSYIVSEQSFAFITEKRLRDMDDAGIEMAVISPFRYIEYIVDPKEAVALAKLTNDECYEIIQQYPKRFAGFAGLPCQDPQAAAKELERAVKELGLKGALIYSHIQGEYLDDRKFWGLFEMAERLDVPIYLHPKEPSAEMIKPYSVYGLQGAVWGFGAEVSLHAMRLIASGLFDRYPRLKMMLGHAGEGIPSLLHRIGMERDAGQQTPEAVNADRGGGQMIETRGAAQSSPEGGGMLCKRQPGEYFKENFYVTTSAAFWAPLLQFVHSVLSPDRILFGTDYPMGSYIEGVSVIDSLPISDEDKEKIYHLNAERILKL